MKRHAVPRLRPGGTRTARQAVVAAHAGVTGARALAMTCSAAGRKAVRSCLFPVCIIAATADAFGPHTTHRRGTTGVSRDRQSPGLHRCSAR